MYFAKFKGSATKVCAAVALAFCSAGIVNAAEISTDPGDYAALPAGVDLGILYYQHAQRNAYYADSNKTPGPFKLNTDIGLLRFVHFTKVGDFVIDPQIIIPFGLVDLKSANLSASGVGDPLLGGTLWLLNNPEQKRWFGISAFASVPVGNYDAAKGPVNLGQNRWKGIFHAGYVTALSEKVMLDIIGEAAVYGDNNDYGGARLTQKESYSAQGHLRYLLSPTSHVAISYYHDMGGETKINGAAQNDKMNNGRWLATFATFVSPDIQVQVQAGQAVTVENGPKESSRFNLRLVKVF